MNGDEDIDVLSASYWDDRIAWYENFGDIMLEIPLVTIE